MLDWKYTPKAKQQTTPAEEPIETKVVAEPEETPEGFASKNAKTITFTVMLVLFLVFLGMTRNCSERRKHTQKKGSCDMSH
jgi:cell division septation protein DedD